MGLKLDRNLKLLISWNLGELELLLTNTWAGFLIYES